MATIKIKLKDTTSISVFEIGINFISNGTLYSKISGNSKGQLLYNDSIVNSDASSWANTKYQYMEIDPTQPNFNAFITAMKDNIGGVELEAGTYKWVSNPSISLRLVRSTNLIFTSNNQNCTSIACQISDPSTQERIMVYRSTSDITVYTLNAAGNNIWANDNYKTIVVDTSQYIDYNFYDTYINSNQLVKQTPTPTAIKLFYHNNKLVSSKGKLLH